MFLNGICVSCLGCLLARSCLCSCSTLLLSAPMREWQGGSRVLYNHRQGMNAGTKEPAWRNIAGAVWRRFHGNSVALGHHWTMLPNSCAVVTVQGLWHWAVARAAAASSCFSLAPLHQLLAVSEFVLAASTETRQFQQISTSSHADWLFLAVGSVIQMTSAQARPQLVTVSGFFWCLLWAKAVQGRHGAVVIPSEAQPLPLSPRLYGSAFHVMNNG